VLGRFFVYHNGMLGSVEVMLVLLGRSRQNFAKVFIPFLHLFYCCYLFAIFSLY